MRNRLLWTLAALAIVPAAAYPVLGQGRAGSPGEDRSYYYTDSRTMDPGPAESQKWVKVGYDYNDDGIIDRFEYLNVEDLDKARTSSMQRQSSANLSRRDLGGTTRDRPAAQAATRESAGLNVVSGTVTDLREVALAGMDQTHLVAKIGTPEGRTARVDFGPVANLRGLDLRQGDKLTVHGTTGTMNDNAMLMAHRIEARGRAVTVGWPNDRNLSRYSGEVLSVRTAAFTNPNVPDQVFARVLLGQGGVTAVNLGPRHALPMSPEDLRGKRIDFLAHPAKIGDRVALVAEELRVEGRTVHVDWSMAVPPA